MPHSLRHIILSRTDGIGDMMLTLPLAGYIKQQSPTTRITMLARAYTVPIAESCAHIDDVLVWRDPTNFRDVSPLIQLPPADAFIHVFPHRTIARLAADHHIPIRIGTSHRLYHWWTCNRLVNLGRKNSSLHEVQLNCRLAEPLFATDAPIAKHDIPALYGFTPRSSAPENITTSTDFSRTIILHPLSQGSAPRWHLTQWRILIEHILAQGWRVIITGSQREALILEPLMALFVESLRSGAIINTCGQLSLHQLISVIAQASALIAASTGPLHIAAALGIPCIGLYVRKRPFHAQRWGPLGQQTHIMEADTTSCVRCSSGTCVCMDSIQPSAVLEKLCTMIQSSA